MNELVVFCPECGADLTVDDLCDECGWVLTDDGDVDEDGDA